MMALQLDRSIVAITVLCFECAFLIGVGASNKTSAEADALAYEHESVENGSHLLHNGSHEVYNILLQLVTNEVIMSNDIF